MPLKIYSLNSKRGSSSGGPRFLRFGESDMKATANIDMTEVINHPTTGLEGNENAAAGAGNIQGPQAVAKEQGQTKGKPESELRAAARRHGLTLKELAAKMSVSYGYLSSVSAGRRPWSPMLRERAVEVLGEVPGPGVVYRQGGVVSGESSFIREQARVVGMSMMELAERVGVSYGYMSQMSRGRRNIGVKVQARVEAVLEAPVKVEPPSEPALTAKPSGTGWRSMG